MDPIKQEILRLAAEILFQQQMENENLRESERPPFSIHTKMVSAFGRFAEEVIDKKLAKLNNLQDRHQENSPRTSRSR